MIETVDSGSTSSSIDLKKPRRPQNGPSAMIAPKLDRLPPHSVEAEQGVLGCVLLSPNDCMGVCIEKFKRGSELFYDLRHQQIYDVLAEMYDQKSAIDLITVQQRLKDRNQLEAIGGITYLAALGDGVPSAANLAYYLEIVREKYLLRKMIQTCTGVVARVYEHEGEVDMLLDEIERDVLKISEERVESDSQTIKDLVYKAIDTIEEFHQRQGLLTGVG